MRSPLTLRRAAVAAVAVAAVAVALSAVIGAAAAPATAATESASAETASLEACTVSQATLDWGFKESFRSYISGTIAHGAWEPIDGAAYETPTFSWSAATGTVAADGAAAEVAFTGGIHFTGHDGLLDTTVANPTLVVDAPGHAVLRLDISGVSMEAAMAGDTTVDTVTQTPFVDVDLSAATVTSDGDAVTIAVTDAPTAITADGFAAFGNYETGTAFDPISFTVTATCPVAEPEPAPTASATPLADVDTAGEGTDASDGQTLTTGVLVAVVAAVAVAAVAVIAVVLVRRRRTGSRTGRRTGDRTEDPSASGPQS